MKDDFVTLTSYWVAHDGELITLKAKLKEAEIPFYIMDENYVNVDPFLAHGLGGVKVRIKEGFWDQSQAILQKVKENRQVELPIEEMDEEEKAYMQERQASLEKQKKQEPIILGIIGFIALIILVLAIVSLFSLLG